MTKQKTAELVRRAAAGDELAWRRFIDGFGPLLPDVSSFWAAHVNDVLGHLQALFRDYETAQEAAPAREGAFASETTPSTAHELSASPPPATSVTVPSRKELFAELSDMYATALEYPVELFTEDVEIEADLGVFSVKKTELLSRAAARYHPPERPADFRLSECSTISKVADVVSGTLMTEAGSCSPRLPSPL